VDLFDNYGYLHNALTKSRLWSARWKAAAKHYKTLYLSLRAYPPDTVTPVPTQVTATSQISSEMLNVAVYSMSKLYDATARLRACAEDAIGIVLSKHKDLVFGQPIPLTMTTLVFVWFQAYMPGQVAIADFAADMHLPDAQLVLSMVSDLETRLGLKV
jgi:hypothetical protein